MPQIIYILAIMNKFEYTEIPNTEGKYGINKDKLVIDFQRGRYLVPYTDGRIKLLYGGVRRSFRIDTLFKLTFGGGKRPIVPEHPIVGELRQLEKDFSERMRAIVRKYQ